MWELKWEVKRSPRERGHRKQSVLGHSAPSWPSRGVESSQRDQAGVGRKAGRNPAEGGASEATGRNKRFRVLIKLNINKMLLRG